MFSDILNGIALEIRIGNGREGIRQLDAFLAEHPNDVDALALGAYENEYRDVAGVPDTNYLERLQAVAPNSALFHSLSAFWWGIDPQDAADAFRRAKAAPLKAQTTVGVEMYLLADVASSEAQFQILCIEPGADSGSMTVSPRGVGLMYLSSRDHDGALEHFRKGAELAQKTAGAVKHPFDESQRAKYALNIWNDCVMGEAMTLADLGHHEEAKSRVEWLTEQYRDALSRIP